jgi:hypothetical protein
MENLSLGKYVAGSMFWTQPVASRGVMGHVGRHMKVHSGVCRRADEDDYT